MQMGLEKLTTTPGKRTKKRHQLPALTCPNYEYAVDQAEKNIRMLEVQYEHAQDKLRMKT